MECYLEDPSSASMERDCLPCMFQTMMECILLRQAKYKWTMGPSCIPCLYGNLMRMITRGEIEAKPLPCPEGLCPFAGAIESIKLFEGLKRLMEYGEVKQHPRG